MAAHRRTRRVVVGGLSALLMNTALSSWAEPSDDDEAAAAETKDKTAKSAKPAAKPKAKAEPPPPKVVSHEFSGAFNGDKLTYTVTAGETFLKNDKGEPTASIFTTAYTKNGATDPSRRPVTFVFNGGPGSASLWLHLGVFGPKRVVLPDDANQAGTAPPYRLEDNPLSLIDVSDLVFIDPVGTGYSHAMGEAKNEDFWGLSADAKSIAQFIRLWLTANGRWNSPKYLAGESYGTLRAARLVQELQFGYDTVSLNGVLLISSILDYHSITFNQGNDYPYVAFLPTYAAAAWFHGKIEPKPPQLAPFLDEVRAFATNAYSVALIKGSGLPAAERKAIIARIAHYTGLSETYIDQTNLRINAFRFMKQLLRDRGRVVGRYDARITGEDYDAAGETFDNDPSLYTVDGAFVSTINDYLTRILKVGIDRHYTILDSEPSRKWKMTDGKDNTYVNVAPHLGQAMRENRDFRVFVANGYYDLATPFFGTEMTMANNGINPDRVVLKYFEAGHMIYTHGPSRERLTRDARAFIKAGG